MPFRCLHVLLCCHASISNKAPMFQRLSPVLKTETISEAWEMMAHADVSFPLEIQASYCSTTFMPYNRLYMKRRGRMVSTPVTYFWRSRLQTSVWRQSTEAIRGFLRSLQANAEILPQIWHWPLPSHPFQFSSH